MLTVGHGEFRYQQDDSWPTLPEGWVMDHPSDLAVDSHDRVYVFNRNKHPMIAFEADTGEFVTSWGEGEFKEPHGIFIDVDDHVWTADRNDHTVVKYTRYGEKLLELGTRGWANMTVTPQGTTPRSAFQHARRRSHRRGRLHLRRRRLRQPPGPSLLTGRRAGAVLGNVRD